MPRLAYPRHIPLRGICCYALQEVAIHIAKIFKNGRSQAIRIPKDFAYEGVTELTVYKIGEKLILEPVRKSWLTLYDEIEPLGADDDFLANRPDLFVIDENRVKFR